MGPYMYSQGNGRINIASMSELSVQKSVEKCDTLSGIVNCRYDKVEGKSKLLKQISSEKKFLSSLEYETDLEMKENQLKSSNLHHIEALVDSLEKFSDVVQVLKPVQYEKADMPGSSAKLVVDVVADKGHRWIKVIARNAMAIHQIWAGDGSYGNKSIADQALQYLSASSQHLIQFHPPSINFVFVKGVTQPVAAELKDLGVTVYGDIVQEDDRPDNTTPEEPDIQLFQEPTSQRKECCRVNLDITTMIVLTSELTNGGCWYKFREPILNDQALQEQELKVLPGIESFLEGKKLYACELAYKSFREIVGLLGGEREKARAEQLLKKVTVVEDQPSQRTLKLVLSGKVKERSKVIFGTGDQIQAITLSANVSFVRAAIYQGVKFDVFLHPSRALTESKQRMATAIPQKHQT